MDTGVEPIPIRLAETAPRYVRVYLGSRSDEPAITLYEIAPGGVVDRMVEIRATGARFAPEDVLMLGTVDAEAMVRHPAAEAFDAAAFEDLWREVRPERAFRGRVPDPDTPWEGTVQLADGTVVPMRWLPDGAPGGGGYRRVRGFDELFARADEKVAERVYRAIFLDPSIVWHPLAKAA
ncbi:MAG: hypothetical protein D6705_08365 [Deltaproteobacteria bacterium]|nr:MAG: hypothetical protein D6705_08365 [Deltaproteobacteria bacterium]